MTRHAEPTMTGRRGAAQRAQVPSLDAQHLARMRGIASYWRTNTDPPTAGFDAERMAEIAERGCLELAAELIAQGM